MKARHKRFILIAIALLAVMAAAALANKAMQGNLSYYRSPTEVAAKDYPQGIFRIGGMIKEDSVIRSDKNLDVTFTVTDYAAEVVVKYTGILPDLFKEGTGAVIKGGIGEDGIFYAKEVLAKHDEKYMPPEVIDTMKKSAASDTNITQNNGYQ